jgi:acyl carrier protein phosphodiesterase
MNYLAHAFLSGDDPGILIGNFIADHVRGNVLEVYPEKIKEGIMMHRNIDTFTDSHDAFRAAKRLFYQGFEKHSGILVDIYFDFFLARGFEKYSSTPLQQFSEKVYDVYKEYEHLFPDTSSRFLQYVIKNNVYESYSRIDEVKRVLFHLSQRIRHGVQLDASIPLFKKQEEELQGLFDRFFRDAMREFSIS